MEVLFKMNERVIELPKYTGITDLGSYGKQYLQYYITKLSEEEGPEYALLLTVALVISTFLFKNLF
jgi:subfamily B ATP-binding cassette protein MsbA